MATARSEPHAVIPTRSSLLGSLVLPVAVYLDVIAIGEVLAAEISLVWATLWNVLLTLVLLLHYIHAPGAPFRRALPGLMLLPLLRIFSVTMPLPDLEQIYWYALVAVPLLIAVGTAARLLNLSWQNLGLRRGEWGMQAEIALSGVPLGFLAFAILRPDPLWETLTVPRLLIGGVILAVFVGFAEEIIFRGLILRTGAEIFGSYTILYSAALFALAYAGSLSVPYIGFSVVVGLLFGWTAYRSESLWGVIVAHSLMAIELVLVLPFVF